jgi:hypothetical protein
MMASTSSLAVFNDGFNVVAVYTKASTLGPTTRALAVPCALYTRLDGVGGLHNCRDAACQLRGRIVGKNTSSCAEHAIVERVSAKAAIVSMKKETQGFNEVLELLYRRTDSRFNYCKVENIFVDPLHWISLDMASLSPTIFFYK